MASDFDIVIVGAGHGGAQAAIKLRQAGYGGTVALITEEADVPYERPPLSKEYLSGAKEFEQIQLRPASFWPERNIELMRHCRVARLDPTAHRVTDAEGHAMGYRKLIWAAGGRARRLTCTGSELSGVHYMRTRRDVDALQADLAGANSVIIIGGGYIGLETAASLVSSTRQVVLLEMEDRVLARVAGVTLSRFYEREHASRGVQLRLSSRVDCILEASGRVSGVRLVDGSVMPASVVVVGIGIIPEVEPLTEAGAAGVNELNVDDYCRTSLEDVYAIGDCAAHESFFAKGRRVRIESVQNAADQASCAVAHILGSGQPYRSVPWFWSNQYDLRLQTVGLSSDHDETFVRGDPASRSFTVVYRRGGQVTALDCVNSPRDFMQGKELILEPAVLPMERLKDRTVPLRSART